MLWQWMYLLDARDQEELTAAEEKHFRDRIREGVFRHVIPGAQTRRIPLRRWGAVAAAAVAIIMVALFRHAGEQGRGIAFNDGPSAKTVYLPDSTKVILDKMASVEWGSSYNRKDRVVRLTGEAYFDVKHNPALAFIVRTGEVETQALGTAFDIEYHKEESEIRVSLLQGKAKVSKDKVSILLSPGQMVEYAVVGGSLKSPVPIAADDVLAWTRGDLVLNDVPLGEALERIQARYRLRLRFDPRRMDGKRVTTVFSHTMSWQDALSNILFLHNMQYVQKDSLILIK